MTIWYDTEDEVGIVYWILLDDGVGIGVMHDDTIHIEPDCQWVKDMMVADPEPWEQVYP